MKDPKLGGSMIIARPPRHKNAIADEFEFTP